MKAARALNATFTPPLDVRQVYRVTKRSPDSTSGYPNAGTIGKWLRVTVREVYTLELKSILTPAIHAERKAARAAFFARRKGMKAKTESEVIKRLQAGEHIRAVAAAMDIPRATIGRWRKRFVETGLLALPLFEK